MEEKIYERQIAKLSLSERVVDERNVDRHYSANDLAELYMFRPKLDEPSETPPLPKVCCYTCILVCIVYPLVCIVFVYILFRRSLCQGSLQFLNPYDRFHQTNMWPNHGGIK